MIALRPQPAPRPDGAGISGLINGLRAHAVAAPGLDPARRETVATLCAQSVKALRRAVANTPAAGFVDTLGAQLHVALTAQTAADRAVASLGTLNTLDVIASAITADTVAKLVDIVGVHALYPLNGNANEEER